MLSCCEYINHHKELAVCLEFLIQPNTPPLSNNNNNNILFSKFIFLRLFFNMEIILAAIGCILSMTPYLIGAGAIGGTVAGIVIGVDKHHKKDNKKHGPPSEIEKTFETCVPFHELLILASDDAAFEARASTLTHHQREALSLFKVFNGHTNPVALPNDPSVASDTAAPQPSYYDMSVISGYEDAILAISADTFTIYTAEEQVSSVQMATKRLLATAAHVVAKEAPGLIEDMGADAVNTQLNTLFAQATNDDVLVNLGDHLRRMHAEHLLQQTVQADIDMDGSASTLETGDSLALDARSMVVPRDLVGAGSDYMVIPTIGVADGPSAGGFDVSGLAMGSAILLLGVVVGFAFRMLYMRRRRGVKSVGVEKSYEDGV